MNLPNFGEKNVSIDENDERKRAIATNVEVNIVECGESDDDDAHDDENNDGGDHNHSDCPGLSILLFNRSCSHRDDRCNEQ